MPTLTQVNGAIGTRHARLWAAAILIFALTAGFLVTRTAQAQFPPSVTGVSPASGPISGGVSVTINGAGFNGVTQVRFGAAGASFQVDSTTQLTAIAPAAPAASVVNVFVTTSFGTSVATVANQYTYTGAPGGPPSSGPVVLSLSPSSGPVTGGTTVIIGGSGFTGASSVTFGFAPASFVVINGNQINAVAPAAVVAGVVIVRVTTPFGTSAGSANSSYTYGTSTLAITNLNPSIGPVGGGNLVIISGFGFSGATSVLFGPYSTTATINSDTQITAVAPASAAAGIVSVRVTTPLGTTPINAASQYTYGSVTLGITALTPANGPVFGGNSVIISGVGFTGATAVTFGAYSASFVVNNANQITAIAPAVPTSGVVNVAVTTPLGTTASTFASQYTFGTSLVTITSLSPNIGPVLGGNTVFITGSGFTGATSVTFGLYGASFTVNNDSQITAIAPAVPTAGIVNVRVVSPAGTSASTLSSQYTFGTSTVTITSVTPASGPIGGGNTVTILGSGFSGASSVTFGLYSAFFTVVSDTQIVATAPAVPTAGVVSVRVTSPQGTSAATASSQYTYGTTSVTVTGVSPSSGPTSGGTTVTISGSGFLGATAVRFGGLFASYTVNSDTRITAVSPARSAGTVDVIVTAPGGQSANSSADNFTYVAPGPQLCPAIPFWVNDLAYGNPGGGFYWDPVSGQVWTPARGWHSFAPVPPRPRAAWLPLWADALTYGSAGEGFYWDPVSGQVWTAERGWHPYRPIGCVPR